MIEMLQVAHPIIIKAVIKEYINAVYLKGIERYTKGELKIQLKRKINGNN